MMNENLEKEIIDVLGNAYGIAKDIFDIDVKIIQVDGKKVMLPVT